MVFINSSSSSSISSSGFSSSSSSSSNKVVVVVVVVAVTRNLSEQARFMVLIWLEPLTCMTYFLVPKPYPLNLHLNPTP